MPLIEIDLATLTDAEVQALSDLASAEVGDASLEVDYPQTVPASTYWIGVVSWETEDPWPTAI